MVVCSPSTRRALDSTPHSGNLPWWLKLVIPAFRRRRQQGQKFKVIPSYIKGLRPAWTLSRPPLPPRNKEGRFAGFHGWVFPPQQEPPDLGDSGFFCLPLGFADGVSIPSVYFYVLKRHSSLGKAPDSGPQLHPDPWPACGLATVDHGILSCRHGGAGAGGES